MLTGTMKVDWTQLPVELYLATLPTLQQGVIAGVFRQKGAAPIDEGTEEEKGGWFRGTP